MPGPGRPMGGPMGGGPMRGGMPPMHHMMPPPPRRWRRGGCGPGCLLYLLGVGGLVALLAVGVGMFIL